QHLRQCLKRLIDNHLLREVDQASRKRAADPTSELWCNRRVGGPPGRQRRGVPEDKADLARVHRLGCEWQALVLPKALAETEGHFSHLPHRKLARGVSMLGKPRMKIDGAACVQGCLQDAKR